MASCGGCRHGSRSSSSCAAAIGRARANGHVYGLPEVVTRLWAGGEGEARHGSMKLVGVLPRRDVLSWHGCGLGGDERCIWSSGECGRVVCEMRGVVWVHWFEEGRPRFVCCKWRWWCTVASSPCRDEQERERGSGEEH